MSDVFPQAELQAQIYCWVKGKAPKGSEWNHKKNLLTLQQIQQGNWQVCNVTTPANYFHVLRRQIHRGFRKPLVVASPKNLLRHKLATSTLEEFGPGTRFHRVLDDHQADVGLSVRKEESDLDDDPC